MARGGPAQGLGITAVQDRWILDANGSGIGVTGPGDLKVSAGLGMASLISAGKCRIRGANAAGISGVYHLINDAPASRTHASADGTNPRIDQIIAKIVDFQEQGSATVEDVAILTGLPTAGATLDNRNGAALLPINSLLLADALVPVSASSAALFTYRDRRPLSSRGLVPTRTGATEQVRFLPPTLGSYTNSFVPTTNDQLHALFYLPRKITATKIKWVYQQDVSGTPITGNYNIGIYDASGRLLASTGAVALTGALGSQQVRSDPIASTTFEAGMYYVMIGWGTIAGAGTLWYPSWPDFNSFADNIGLYGPNVFGRNNAGGTSLPQPMGTVAFDGGTAANVAAPVPLVALGV